MFFKKSIKYYFFLWAVMGIWWSCGNSKKSICCDNVEIVLNCDRRKWEIKAIAPILSKFSEVDSISYFWPIDPESRNRIFKAKENNIYIIFQHCDYHFEGGITLRYYADAFSIKMKDSGATQMSMMSGSIPITKWFGLNEKRKYPLSGSSRSVVFAIRFYVL